MNKTAPRPSEAPPPSILDGYEPPKGFFDEFLDENGEVRSAWRTVEEGLRNIGPEELRRRVDYLHRVIRDNGITYNVYGQEDGTHRPWMMDVLPLAVSHEEWSWLEDALVQRVSLLNEILADAYGPQRLLAEGHLPRSLVLGNPGFLRPVHGFSPAHGRYIHIYAADLARSPDGRWWVLNDRLEAASGIGYALENRVISSRVLPDLFRQAGVHRLQAFLKQFCDSFEALVPGGVENPRIVFLTPGPANETYFEQSFLARNLGYPLVEGADLTVRDERVFLKTISGTQQVHVIIRRVDADFCDPLELRSDSLLGVPGLINAMRRGNVAIANVPGCSLLETAAFPAFLPTLCQQLRSEPLKIPSVATWWCGQPREKTYVIENLSSLVIKPTFRKAGGRSIFGPSLNEQQRADLTRLIEAFPENYCAQELVAQATAPVLAEGGAVPRHFLVRVFMVPFRNRWALMPGGLTRVAPKADDVSVSMQQGGESKDTWVLLPPRSQDDDAPALTEESPVPIVRESDDLPSRLADNLFWLGRYVERGETLARVLRVLVNTFTEEAELENQLAAVPLFGCFLPYDEVATLTEDDPPGVDFLRIDQLLARQIWGLDYPGSLRDVMQRIEMTAYSVKERLSEDTWNLIARLRALMQGAGSEPSLLKRANYLDFEALLGLIGGVKGLLGENMTRGDGWVFLDIGRRVEGAISMLLLLRAMTIVVRPREEAVLGKLLACCDSLLTYRRRYLTRIQLKPALDLLLLDRDNPRSVSFLADQIEHHLGALPHRKQPGPIGALDRASAKLQLSLKLCDLDALCERLADGERPDLDAHLTALTSDLMTLSEELGRFYFALAERGTRPATATLLT